MAESFNELCAYFRRITPGWTEVTVSTPELIVRRSPNGGGVSLDCTCGIDATDILAAVERREPWTQEVANDLARAMLEGWTFRETDKGKLIALPPDRCLDCDDWVLADMRAEAASRLTLIEACERSKARYEERQRAKARYEERQRAKSEPASRYSANCVCCRAPATAHNGWLCGDCESCWWDAGLLETEFDDWCARHSSALRGRPAPVIRCADCPALLRPDQLDGMGRCVYCARRVCGPEHAMLKTKSFPGKGAPLDARIALAREQPEDPRGPHDWHPDDAEYEVTG